MMEFDLSFIGPGIGHAGDVSAGRIHGLHQSRIDGIGDRGINHRCFGNYLDDCLGGGRGDAMNQVEIVTLLGGNFVDDEAITGSGTEQNTKVAKTVSK